MSIQVSVVIATYKRSALLERCLEALINQSVECDTYEVIVVTDGPDEESVAKVDEVKSHFAECPFIRCISPAQKKGPAAARNIGWQNAKGKLILFTDDDCVPLFYWIENMLTAYNEDARTEIAFSGQIKVPVSPKPTDHERNTALLEKASFVTANCACSKKALEKINGLDEEFTMAWREDSALEFDLFENNIPIVKVSVAIVVHPVRTAPWGTSIKEQKKSMFNPLLYKKHPVLYKQKIHKRPPLLYYGIIFCAIVTLITALLQQGSVMHISMIACVTFIGLFTFKRLTGASHAPRHIIEMIVTSSIIPFLSVYWTLYGAVRYKIFFLWHNHKQHNVLRSPSYAHYN